MDCGHIPEKFRDAYKQLKSKYPKGNFIYRPFTLCVVMDGIAYGIPLENCVPTEETYVCLGNIMSACIIDEHADPEDEMLLSNLDYPHGYVNMKHVDDNVIKSEPITPVLTPVLSEHHNRLIARVSFKIDSAEFLSISFVCDTGAPGYFYFSDEVLGLTPMKKRFLEDEDTGMKIILTSDGRKAPYARTPDVRQPGNIMGLKLLYRFGLKLSHPRMSQPEFKLEALPDCL